MAWAIVYYVKMGSREPQYSNKSTVPTLFLYIKTHWGTM